MSPLDAARAATNAVRGVPAVRPGRAARPTPPRPRLTVVPPLRAPAPRAPFVLLVGALLTAGLGTLLFLHTAIAEDSFRLHDLTARSALLADREQALDQEIAVAAAPQRLAARAKALGMVRSENPAFIRTSDGRILGKPKPGTPPPPPPVRVTPSPSAGSNASPAPSAAAATVQSTKPKAPTATSTQAAR